MHRSEWFGITVKKQRETKKQIKKKDQKRQLKTAEDSYRQLSGGMKDRNVPFIPLGCTVWLASREIPVEFSSFITGKKSIDAQLMILPLE
jgi:hypothetical protein